MTIRKWFSGLGLLALALIVLVSTLVADRLFTGVRIDLTENNLYTLSEGSQRIVQQLDAPVTLHFFFSQSATRDALGWRDYAKQVQELLEEFVLASNGRLTLRVIDPEPFSEAEDQAAEFGLQAVPLAGADPVYFGLVAAVESGSSSDGETPRNRTEVIDFFQPDRQEFLEYDIARIIYQASLTEKPKVGLISGLDVMGGFDMMRRTPKPAWMVMQQVQQLFEVEVLENELDEISNDIGLLVVIHPKSLPASTLFAIDQHALKGGRVLLFVDPFAEQDASAMAGSVAADQSSDVPDLFGAWGVAYDPLQFVADYGLALQVSMQQGARTVRHLGILQFADDQISDDDMIVGQLDSLNVSSAGALSMAEGAETTLTPLLWSSDQAMLMSSDKLSFLNNPEDLLKDFKPDGQRYTIAARVSGPAQTAFPEGVPVEPAQPEADGESDSGADATEKAPQSADAGQASTESTRDSELITRGEINVLIVADTDILSDRLWVQIRQFFDQQIAQPFADNGAFFFNSVDNLSGSNDLISIRNRGRFLRPFTVVQDMQRSAEATFRDREQALQQQLQQTESKLMELQNQRDDSGNMMTLTPEQEAEIQRFQDEKLRIRRELRNVQHQLNRDIDALDFRLKVINIALVPALIALLGVGVAWAKRRRLRRSLRQA